MLSRLRSHINPATVVAMVALFVALGGVSYAAVKIDGSNIQKASIPGSKLENGAVTNRKVKKGSLRANRLSSKARATLKGATGATGPEGKPGPQGAPGAQGPQGPAGTALAYAQVQDSGPSLVSDRTSGITTVARPQAGVYCLTPSDAVLAQAFDGGDPTRATVATVEYGNTGTPTDEVIVEVRGATVVCPSNTFEVHTYRKGAVADNVAFTFIVP